MSNHKSECNNPACPLSLNTEFYLPATGAVLPADNSNYSDPILVLHLIFSIYKVYSKISNFKATLHLTYSDFLFSHMGNIHLAIIELDLANKMSPSMQQSFTIYRNRKFIEEFLMTKYSNKASSGQEKRSFQSLDVTVVMEFENLYSKLYKAIEKSANEHIEFWSQLNSLLPDLNLLHKLGLNITDYNKKTEDIWKHLYKINPNHHKALRNYGSYLKDIRNDEETGEEFIEKAQGLNITNSIDERMNDFSIMFADDTAIITMSAGNRETQGKIIKTNTGITNLFRYNSVEVVGQDVNILMPRSIAINHGQFLDNYFNTGREKMINSEREVYAIRRTGELFCISTMIKLVPSLKEDIEYIAIIRERNKDCKFILTDPYGKIDSMSEALVGKLEIQHNFFKENEVYIQFLFPDLLDVQQKQDGTAYTMMEKMQGRSELSFILPKDFVSKIQGYNKHSTISAQLTGTDQGNDSSIEIGQAEGKHKGKIPDPVKKIALLIYGAEHKEDLVNTPNILKKVIDYEVNEMKEDWIVELNNLDFGNGKCQLKIFKILDNKMNEEATSERYYNERNKSSKINDTPKKIERLKNSDRDHENLTTSLMARNSIYEEQKNSEYNREENYKDELEEPKDTSKDAQNDSLMMESKGKLTPKEDEVLPVVGISRLDNQSPNEQNNVSQFMNNSQAELAPLVTGQSFLQPVRGLNENYLSKANQNQKEQEDIIRSIFKSTVDGAQHPESGNKAEKKVEVKKEVKHKEDDMNDEVGSVASRTKSLMKHIRALRSAVYEQYCPGSVQQLTYV